MIDDLSRKDVVLEIDLKNDSKSQSKKLPPISIRLNGIEVYTRTNEDTATAVNAATAKTRNSRGSPIYFIVDNVMRQKYPTAARNKEIPVTIDEYKMITNAFFKDMDPTGRVRWTANSLKALGLNPAKIGAVKHFLIKLGVLKGALRAFYGDRAAFLNSAQNAWGILAEKGIIN